MLQENERTASSMLSRYKFYLRRNYSKYINEPSALNQFKDIERIRTNMFV
uniref:Uncharacterized protein n=1 Tax=Bracon brevicornis TaxID=1563983 RepID=A0A6V7LYY6_9HYME